MGTVSIDAAAASVVVVSTHGCLPNSNIYESTQGNSRQLNSLKEQLGQGQEELWKQRKGLVMRLKKDSRLLRAKEEKLKLWSLKVISESCEAKGLRYPRP